MNAEILEQVQRLARAYGKENIEDERIELYAEELSEIPPEHMEAVVKVLVRTSRFFPTIAEVYHAWSDLVLGPPAPDQALEWCLSTGKRQESEAFTDYYATPIFERPAVFRWVPKAPSVYPDPVTKEAVRLFGWQELIEADPEYRPAQWRKVYGQARELVSKRVQSGAVELRGLEGPVSMIERKATA